ncbi:AraC family transcriptional regulator [Chitinophaga sp. Mgbs1]|uniref:AraC family transcriptional regulator n=1 Tax=Chitinophaga solisilvae TaxID=1233460 RepID=A0A3S1B098_9BACT|nr:AraC family transcriptional regulator [Chitinophaga solisilvae]
MYQQYTPHIALTSFIDAYWTVSVHTRQAQQSRILPDGCVDIICNLGNEVPDTDGGAGMLTDRAYLVGTMTQYSVPVMQADTRLTGIRFKPAGFAAFYDLHLQEATDNCIPFAQELVPLLHKAGSDFTAQLDQYFLHRLTNAASRLIAITQDIQQQHGLVKIADLASRHFITPRQLERQFMKFTGVSPKAFSNIVRYQHVHHLIKNMTPGVSMQTIAFENGYYDHAHLANDIRKYTGLTPTSL